MFNSATARAIIVLALPTALFSGCGIDVPTLEALRSPNNPSRAFIVDEEDMRGIYANFDVDSCIYQYTTSETDAIRFWEAVEARAAKADWKPTHEERDIRRYDRIEPAVGQRVAHSAEQVRIALDDRTRTVTVAWVQVDVPVSRAKPPTEFPKSKNSEVDFADNEIWPRFEKLVSHQ